MHKKRLCIAVVLGLLSANTLAAEDRAYQHDATLSYGGSTESFSDGSWGANYRYYFTPVSQDSVPYAISGFLAQTSNIGGGTGLGDDIDAYNIDGEYVFASKWFIGARYANIDADVYESDNYSLNLGYYFNSTSSVYIGYGNSRSDYSAGIGSKGKSDSDSVTLGVRSFIPLQSTAGVDLKASVSYGESTSRINDGINSSWRSESDSTSASFGADWYILQAWSIGANYNVTEGTDPYDINTAYHWRITDFISLRASVTKYIEPDVDGANISLGVNGRF